MPRAMASHPKFAFLIASEKGVLRSGGLLLLLLWHFVFWMCVRERGTLGLGFEFVVGVD